MYSFTSRVRYSETDQEGYITMQSILDYFQDCSTFHSEDLGVGMDYLAARNLVWVLSAWQIVVKRYPKMGETIKIGTFPYGFKGFMGLRNFFIEDEAGEKIAFANSIWTLVDLEAGRPTRPLPEMIEKYILEEKLPMDYAPRKIEVCEKGVTKESLEVKTHHLDTNQHVNNGQYIRIAMDSLGLTSERKRFHQLRAEYKKSALLGDIMIPFVSSIDGKDLVELCSANGEQYAIVELA